MPGQGERTISSDASAFQIVLEESSPITTANQHLHPSRAIHNVVSPPRARGLRAQSPLSRSDTLKQTSTSDSRKRRDQRRGRSSSRRRIRPWKKLLWIKQSYPDNYTDEETFLDHLQWNPRFRPYEFWPLVADSTIIVQHVSSVIIFVCCFVGIFQERVSPTTVVGWATFGTVASWILKDYWHTQDEADEAVELQDDGSLNGRAFEKSVLDHLDGRLSLGSRYGSLTSLQDVVGEGSRLHSRNASTTRLDLLPGSIAAKDVGIATPQLNLGASADLACSTISPRMTERLTTAKSAVLIYFSLLGLSPILKSLTKSTSSDSIWALSTWLMCINVFTFDYGAGPDVKFPASLSTNAALMASTVLASRLPSTTHVFSLTLFSIEVFGLFPVFRRHLKHQSWTYHVWLTIFLVVFASAGLSMVIAGGGFGYAILGVFLGGIATGLSMGVTSWWLIGLQRYKNEIHGPWDPARPVIRRHWE